MNLNRERNISRQVSAFSIWVRAFLSTLCVSKLCLITNVLGSYSKVTLPVEGLLAPLELFLLGTIRIAQRERAPWRTATTLLRLSPLLSLTHKCNLRSESAHKQIPQSHRSTSSHWLNFNSVVLCAINPVHFFFFFSYCCTPRSSNHPRLVILHYKFPSHFHKPLMLHASGWAYLLANKRTPLPLPYY